MTPEIFSDKLMQSAKSLGWPSTLQPDFASPKFRGRHDASATLLPEATIGLRLGAYLSWSRQSL